MWVKADSFRRRVPQTKAVFFATPINIYFLKSYVEQKKKKKRMALLFLLTKWCLNVSIKLFDKQIK